MTSWRSSAMLSLLLLLVIGLTDVDAKRPPFRAGPWKSAHATFYGGADGSGTLQGACGYGDLQNEGYGGFGLQTVALSSVLFNNGAACGACYEIKCDNAPQWCNLGASSITVTANNYCPSNYGPEGGWCNPPREHFDLSQSAFLQIAKYKAGIVPVQYRRVPCKRTGGIRFTISLKSNPWFILVQVWNVGGAGDVSRVMIKGSDGKPFKEMSRNWGQFWDIHENFVGQSITFRVKASDDRSSTSWHVVPRNWQFGQTFQGKNFR
ncbi:Expansin-A4-like protein [Drosera capensis]